MSPEEVRLAVLTVAAERRDLEPEAIVVRAKVFEQYVTGEAAPKTNTLHVPPKPTNAKPSGK